MYKHYFMSTVDAPDAGGAFLSVQSDSCMAGAFQRLFSRLSARKGEASTNLCAPHHDRRPENEIERVLDQMPASRDLSNRSICRMVWAWLVSNAMQRNGEPGALARALPL
jgi:hypothetical protein